MARFRPVEILKGKLKLKGKNVFTQSLVVTQFVLSIFLIITTVIMNHQVNYMIKADPGFDREGIVVIRNHEEDEIARERTVKLFKDSLEPYKNILIISESSRQLGQEKYLTFSIKENGENFRAHNIRVSFDYFKTLKIDVIKGRSFSEEMPTDKSGVVINESFARQLGVEDCIGLTLKEGTFERHPMKIIGIVKDYYLKSLHYTISPVLHYMNLIEARDRFSFIYVRILPHNISATMDLLRSTWKKLEPERPFEYSVLDKDFEAQYGSERRWRAIVFFSSIFAILISLMGIFGLTSITFSNRIKEVGIRKVLGASVNGMVLLLSKDLIRWILFANCLAWPLAYFIMNRWLQNFAYRINMTVWPFILSTSLAVLLAIITISYQIIKTALANPVDALRYE
jgi:putative ABC transport system permease protein